MSLNALQQYETATEIQLLDVSNVLSNNRKLKTGVVPDTKGDGALQTMSGQLKVMLQLTLLM